MRHVSHFWKPFVAALLTAYFGFSFGCADPLKRTERKSLDLNVGAGTSNSLARKDLSEKDVVDAYIYIMGRYLVIRQEEMDTAENKIGYNAIQFSSLGKSNVANPNLDMTYLEAWLAVDDKTCQVLQIPKIEGRYYTVQVMDEWAEVLTNINERNYPRSPNGLFSFCLKDAKVHVLENSYRIDLPSRKAKLVARIERKNSDAEAMRLQGEFKLIRDETTQIDPPVRIPMFSNKNLLRVEAFNKSVVKKVLASAPDGMKHHKDLQAKVLTIADYADISPANRDQIDDLVREKALPQFMRYLANLGERKGSWSSTASYADGFGEDYWFRTAANFGSIWWNVAKESVFLLGNQSSTGQPLDARFTYLIHFPKGETPDDEVEGFWSLTLLSSPDYHVVPNSLNRYQLNNMNKLAYEKDGSLILAVGAKPKESYLISNWIPGPKTKTFSLNLRLYAPKDAVLQGKWSAPPLVKVEELPVQKTSSRELEELKF